MSVVEGRQSIRDAFALHRWRLRSLKDIEEVSRGTGEQMVASDASIRRRWRELERLVPFAPYFPALHLALAERAERVGDVESFLRHLKQWTAARGVPPTMDAATFGHWSAEQHDMLRRWLDNAQRPRRPGSFSFQFVADTQGVIRCAGGQEVQFKLAYESWLASASFSPWPSEVASVSLDDLMRGEVFDALAGLPGPERIDETPFYFSYELVLSLLAALAPHVQDLRLMSTCLGWVDELWVAEGTFFMVRHQTDYESAPRYFQILLEEVPGDEALRAYVGGLWKEQAEDWLALGESNAARQSRLREEFGPEADKLHDVHSARVRGRNAVKAAHAIDKAFALGADTVSLSRRLSALLGQASLSGNLEAIERYDALATHAQTLLVGDHFVEALGAIELASRVEPEWYEGSTLLRGLALDGLGRTRSAESCYRAHSDALRDSAPHELLADADLLLAQSRAAVAEPFYRALFGVPFVCGVAARVGAARCRVAAGDFDEARRLFEVAVAEGVTRRASYPQSGITAGIERYEQVAREGLAELDVLTATRRSGLPG